MESLDQAVPILSFVYGLIMIVIGQSPRLLGLARTQFSDAWAENFKQKQPLALICLIVGGLWTIQNFWLN
ncbi:MAG: hypothetical protein IT289_05360 [Oligoflexia bacterium]|nr:hypothetical protein [Oligoflexia bacterium]